MVRVLMRPIALEVAAQYGLTLDDLKGPSRLARICLARQEAFWRIRNETAASLTVIGNFFNRDHATVLVGAAAHERRYM